MTILSIILLILAAGIVLILVMAALASSDYTIEKSIVINKPVQEVFNYIKILKNSNNFSKWNMIDAGMKKDYKGTDGTVGFTYYWNSENKQVGKGEQEIKNIIDGQRVDYEIRFIKPFVGVSQAHIQTQATGNDQTTVTWIFGGSRTFMLKVMHIVLNLKKVLGNDLQAGLNNLKALLEK